MKHLIHVINKDLLFKNLWIIMVLVLLMNYKHIIEKSKKIYGKIKLDLQNEIYIGIMKMVNYQQKVMILFIGGELKLH